MDDKFLLYIDRLKKGEKENLNLFLPPDIFEVVEDELSFQDPVEMHGEAYVSEPHLIIHFSAQTKVCMPCSVCNEKTKENLIVKNAYHTFDLQELTDATLSFIDIVRESLLLELPQFIECQNGHCPNRPLIEPYLHNPEDEKKDDIHYPFSGLDNL
jgi:uncharacterized metal-binding protein YceD (DUF177 family)